MPSFQVTVSRTVTRTVDELATIEVEAEDEAAARRIAEDMLSDEDDDIEWEYGWGCDEEETETSEVLEVAEVEEFEEAFDEE